VSAHVHQDASLDGSLDDVGTCLIELEDGTSASLMAGWANPPGNPRGLEARFEILCSKGVFLVSKPYVDYGLADESSFKRPSVGRSDIEGLTEAFIQSIEGAGPVQQGGALAKDALEVILAAYRSARSGKAVTLPLSDEP